MAWAESAVCQAARRTSVAQKLLCCVTVPPATHHTWQHQALRIATHTTHATPSLAYCHTHHTCSTKPCILPHITHINAKPCSWQRLSMLTYQVLACCCRDGKKIDSSVPTKIPAWLISQKMGFNTTATSNMNTAYPRAFFDKVRGCCLLVLLCCSTACSLSLTHSHTHTLTLTLPGGQPLCTDLWRGPLHVRSRGGRPPVAHRGVRVGRQQPVGRLDLLGT